MNDAKLAPVAPNFAASEPANVSPPVAAPADVAPTVVAPNPGLIVEPVSRSGLVVAGVIGVVLLSILMLFVVLFLVVGLGPDAFALGGVMALVPFAIVFFAVRWIDRWEPEPRLAVVFAFLWGSAVAVIIALVVGAQVENVVNSLGGPGAGYEFFGAVIQAPIVEETGKGLGLLILFWVARKFYDGPVDGLVYAAWLAGGFAFTENILYFGSQLLDVGGVDASVVEIFIVRGIMSPFAHIMFTACTGIALGFAARRTGAFGAIGYFFLGLIPAILLHALWNGALFVVDNFFVYYAIVQFPLFILAIVAMVALRKQETRITRDRLTDYATVGWFAPAEVDSLATPNGRRAAIVWAKEHGVGPEMKQYIRDATRLAFARQRIITGRGKIGAQADEAVLLSAIIESRTALGAV